MIEHEPAGRKRSGKMTIWNKPIDQRVLAFSVGGIFLAMAAFSAVTRYGSTLDWLASVVVYGMPGFGATLFGVILVLTPRHSGSRLAMFLVGVWWVTLICWMTLVLVLAAIAFWTLAKAAIG